LKTEKKNRNCKARRNNYRRLRWLRHVIRMEACRIPNEALNWNLSSMNRKPERPRKTGRTLFKGI